MTVNERIKLLISKLDLTQESFGKKIGLTRVSVSQWVTNKSDPDPKTLIKILRTFPSVNANWLLQGHGNMLVDDKKELSETKSDLNESYQVLVKKKKAA